MNPDGFRGAPRKGFDMKWDIDGQSQSGNDRYGSSRSSHPRDDRRDRDRERDRGGDRDRDRDRDRERRRSRSPRGHRGRRDEENTYSSSRDHRDRERERNYTRRDDRGWDRDRGPRGGGRDDDRRRAPRDDYDDRRGGGRRDRDGGFGDRGGRERKRSASPLPVKVREPTPDLTPFTSILKRQRRMTQWDIKPPGYENITAEQAKLSGMFPLPGAPRQQPMDPARLQALVSQPQNLQATSALKPSMARQSKRLFVYNIPSSTTADELTAFFNLQLNGLNVIKGIDPVVNALLAPDRSFAMLEFRNPGDATVALALDGISMVAEGTANGEANGAPGLSIRRPKDYIAPSATVPSDSDMQIDSISQEIPDTTEKILITNLAPFLDTAHMQQLLVAIGPLRALVLAVDSNGESRGFAFCEYKNPEATTVAFEGLQNMDIGGQPIKLQRACVGQSQLGGEMGVATMSMLAGSVSATMEKTRVLQLLNMTTPEELMRDDDYEDLMEDVRDECQKFGKVLDIKIPRPAGSRSSSGIGKIFVKFETTDVAQKAMAALAGRKYADRTVIVSYFGEEYFEVNAW